MNDNFPTAAFDPNVTHTFGGQPPGGPPVATGAADGDGDPDRVPGYRIVRELGRGGMGVVYLAVQTDLNREVALKMVLAGGHASAAALARFTAEAKAVAAVRHPNVVQVYGYGTAGGLPYFALEYCPGGTFAEKLAGTPLAPDAAADAVRAVAGGVQAAHAAGIVHRDLKPANVLVAADGTLKITDFGLARVADSASNLTASGAVLGSPSYMAPEQASGAVAAISERTDVYALGAILYECLTGRPPFRAATAVETVVQVIDADPLPPSRLVPKLPKDLETVALKCLAKEPAKRYASAAEVADELARFRAGEPIRARPVSGFARMVKWAKRRPAIAGLIAAVCLLAGMVVGVMTASAARLKRERDEANQQREEAKQARAEADAAKGQAQRRLELAADAVEQLMVRVAGERWARKPELQDERRAVLAQAIAFFNGLGTEESRDPVVRRQAAKAHLAAAGAAVALAEYDACQASAAAARDLYRGLRAESPADTAFLRGEAEAALLLGHAAAITARFADAQARYQDARALAAEAARLDPDRPENALALADANASLAQFYSFQQPAQARVYHEAALALGRGLIDRGAGDFRARLVTAAATVNLGVLDLTGGRPADAAAKLAAADAEVKELDKLTPPTARAAEMFVLLKAGVATYQGVLLVTRKQADRGLARLREGVALISDAKAAQPKSFPLRVTCIQYKVQYADALGKADKPAEAAAVLAEVAAEQAALAGERPDLAWVRTLGLTQRSFQLVYRVRAGYDPGFAAEADALLAAAAGTPTGPAVRYNVACGFAMASRVAPPADRDRHAARAVALLDEVRTTSDYFKAATNVRHLDADTDLDPLRDRADFKAFLAAAKGKTP